MDDNPFSRFKDLNFDIDGEEPKLENLLEQNDSSSNDDYSIDQYSALNTEEDSEITKIQKIRPILRQATELMKPEEINTELNSYNMPNDALAALSPKTRQELLENIRLQDDVENHQTIEAIARRNGIVPSEVIPKQRLVEKFDINTEKLTPGELNELCEYAQFKKEDTDEIIEEIRDIITQARNGVNSRRDYSSYDSYYDPERAERQERLLDKINDYLDNGGYESYVENINEVSEEERTALKQKYGNDYVFDTANREELIELGYLQDDSYYSTIGPLNDDDIRDIDEFAKICFAESVTYSAKHHQNLNDISPNITLNPKRHGNISIYDYLVFKKTKEIFFEERTLEPKNLIPAFSALEKSFFGSGISEELKEYLKKSDNRDLLKTINNTRRNFMYGGRLCNLLLGGKDEDVREKYGSFITFDPEFITNNIQAGEQLNEDQNDRIRREQSEFVILLDSKFKECRVAYEALNDLKKALDEQETQRNNPENKDLPPALSNRSVKKLIQISEAQLNSTGDIEQLDPSED